MKSVRKEEVNTKITQRIKHKQPSKVVNFFKITWDNERDAVGINPGFAGNFYSIATSLVTSTRHYYLSLVSDIVYRLKQ